MRQLILIYWLVLLVDFVTARVTTYDQNVCGRVIQVGKTDKAGHLIYRYSPRSSEQVCNITIQTSGLRQTMNYQHHIAYTFLEITAQNNYKCSSVIYYDNGYTRDKYCSSNVYPRYTQITRENALSLTVVGDGITRFEFELLFLSFHNGSCLSYETRCNGLLGDPTVGSACVDYNLICHETYTFCAATGSRCEDISTDTGTKNTLVAVLVVTLVLLLLVSVGCFLCYKNNFCGFLKRNHSEEDRAMNIFSLQLSSRGVDGNDNTAYADDESGPIDFSKFDPPPEYGSLEHLDSVGTSETDGNRSPKGALPSYGDVMNNFDDYAVITQL